jgi:hypothetical protein
MMFACLLHLLQTSLVLLDEVHLLNEAGRGSSLEAGTVCRIKMVSQIPELTKVRCRQHWAKRRCRLAQVMPTFVMPNSYKQKP